MAFDPNMLIDRIENLPSPPEVATSILNSAVDDSDFGMLSTFVEADPALAMRVLKLANSPKYGRPREPLTLEAALVRIGLKLLRGIVLGVHIRDVLLTSGNAADSVMETVWRHSLTVAVAAEYLAQQFFLHLKDQAFTAGLVHDCGRLLLLGEVGKSLAENEGLYLNGEELCEAERDFAGLDHAVLGARLVRAWELPENLAEAVESHHLPVQALGSGGRDISLSGLIALCDAIALDGLAEDACPESRQRMKELWELADIPSPLVDVSQKILLLAAERAAFFENSFGADDASGVFFFQSLQRANQKLVSLHTSAERAHADSAESNKVLKAVSRAGVSLGSCSRIPELCSVASRLLQNQFHIADGGLLIFDVESSTFRGCRWENNAGLSVIDSDSVSVGKSVPSGVVSELTKRVSILPDVRKVLGLGHEDEYLIAPFSGGDNYHGTIFFKLNSQVPGRDNGHYSSGLLLLAELCGNALERIAANEELTLRNERLAGALRKMHKMQLKLKQSERLAAVGQLAAGAAHEINNPLAIIYARTQLLEQKESDPSRRTSFQQMKEQIERITSILRDLMDFARPATPSIQRISLVQVLEKNCAFVQEGLEKAGIAVRKDISGETPSILGDAQQLEQVVLNLVINAEHAMEAEGGVLTFRCGQEKAGWCYFSIEDTGVGIDKETLGRVFDPFFSTKDEGKGTGLGLSMCYSIIQAHGGSISMKSEPGKGTAVTVLLPCEDEQLKEQAAVHGRGLQVGGERKRILVVDDEQHIREILRESLESSGYAVSTSESGEQALRALAREMFGLVVLDIRMPGRDGLEVLRRLKKADIGVPVIVLTGMASKDEIKQAMELGAVKVMLKPFSMSELLESVELYAEGLK